MAISYFFIAAAGGFVLLATVGIQALVALFSTTRLARQKSQEIPDFDLKRAHHRIIQVVLLTTILFLVISALVIHFLSHTTVLGYLFGMVLAFLMSLKRLSPKNEQNRKNFEEAYADCYPPSAVNPDDAAQQEEAAPPKSDV